MKFPTATIVVAVAASCLVLHPANAFVPHSSSSNIRAAIAAASKTSLQAQIFSVGANHVAIGDTIVESSSSVSSVKNGKKNNDDEDDDNDEANSEATPKAPASATAVLEREDESALPPAATGEPSKDINGIKMTLDGTVSTPRKSKKQVVENKKETKSDSSTSSADGGSSFGDRIANSGVASAAAMATAAVNAAVAMKTLEAPDVTKSYISLDKENNALDEDGLPLVYDKDLIEQYWRKERGALNKRWSYFVGKAVPFLTRLVGLFIADGKIEDKHIPSLSQQARIDLQDLGPTFIKAGQMMSVRPDVLPQATLEELEKLQDSVEPFDTSVAVQQIERELGGPLGQFFTSISEEPIAAASLAQVYLATLNDGKNTKVAVKVQRPEVLSTVSKDLYVLRRAAEVFQGLVERFAPQQKTNYVALLNEWAIGFYTELDFENEARNQITLRNMLRDKNIQNVTVPKVYDELCTRRILVSEFMEGKKLSDCNVEEIGEITPMAQEAFLTQLFEVGFFHAGE